MKRSDFFKSIVGLVGVAGSLKELSLINTPIVESLPYNTRVGDLVMSPEWAVYYFDGRFIKKIDTGERILAIPSIQNSKYQRFSSSIGESN